MSSLKTKFIVAAALSAGMSMLIVLIVVVKTFVPWPWCHGSPVRFSLHNRKKNKKYKRKHTHHHIALDKDACHTNLRNFKSVMQKHSIPFWISEGTALGATREGDFIDHDDDVDVGVWSSHIKAFEQLVIPDLKKMNFTVDDVSQKGTFITMSRFKEKLDIDFTGPGIPCMAGKTHHAKTNRCDDIIPFLDTMSLVSLHGELYPCPGIAYLQFLYGSDWMVPQRVSKK